MLHRMFPILLCLTSLVAAAPTATQPTVTQPATTQPATHAVLFAHRVTNVGTVQAQNVVAICILPATSRYQDVVARQLNPKPMKIVKDALGQEVIYVPLGTIPPGQTRSVRVMGWVRFKPVEIPLNASKGDIEPLADGQRTRLLQDEPLLQVEQVKPQVVALVKDKASDIDKAKALYEHVVANCKYDLDENLDLPTAVLKGDAASCSELAATYAAMCRAAEIPARLVTAFVNREGTSPSADWRTHRWVEFYAQDIGWVPADPTNQLNYPKLNFFGQQLPKYLVVVDDGEDLQGMPDPRWQTIVVYREPASAKLIVVRGAVWRSSIDQPTELAAFESAITGLHDKDVAARKATLAGFAGDLMRVGFLLEACYDEDAEVRRAAAEAIGKTRDVSIMIALMDFARAEKDDATKRAFISAAEQLLRIDNDKQRAKAVSELAKSRCDEALELLDGIWNDDARDVRAEVARKLYKLGDKPKVHEGYRKLVDDKDEYIAVMAAIRWSTFGGKEAITRLVKHLHSTNRWDREKSFEALRVHCDQDFGFHPGYKPTTRRNREALTNIDKWLAQLPDDHAASQ